ncbi:iron-sulfur cluster assembly scaffold protein [Sulfurimonas sp. HSL-1716]|uniref:iron-sulfur cluster assembly scaffold protein n=1 Tax=Hydrocurvibacter sulfurireducens TaxID=3131937 RepID=UPI0031F7CA54
MFEKVKMPQGMNPEILEHLMHPKNYGKLEDSSGVGIGVDEKTGEYVIFYIQTDDDIIKDVRYATNGCQDTVVVGSMFTEMIKNKNIDYGQKAISKMEQKLGGLTSKQRVCTDMVLEAFVASLINHEHFLNGVKEEVHIIKMQESCDETE